MLVGRHAMDGSPGQGDLLIKDGKNRLIPVLSRASEDHGPWKNGQIPAISPGPLGTIFQGFGLSMHFPC